MGFVGQVVRGTLLNARVVTSMLRRPYSECLPRGEGRRAREVLLVESSAIALVPFWDRVPRSALGAALSLGEAGGATARSV
jgi:hypothetical protein